MHLITTSRLWIPNFDLRIILQQRHISFQSTQSEQKRKQIGVHAAGRTAMPNFGWARAHPVYLVFSKSKLKELLINGCGL